MLKQNLNKIIAVFIITIGTIFIAGCGDSIPEGMDAGTSGPGEGGEEEGEEDPEGGDVEGGDEGEGETGADPESGEEIN